MHDRARGFCENEGRIRKEKCQDDWSGMDFAPNARPVAAEIITNSQSANDLTSHDKWISDINETSKTNLQFPIIADADRNIAWTYDMLDTQDTENIDQKGIAFTIRSVFVIDPSKKIRLTMMYPASTGRNTSEVLRVIDSLQTGDGKGVTTPINWM